MCRMWNNQDQICEVRKLNGLSKGAGILSSVIDTKLFISKGILYLAKKDTDAGRYYASEFMRDPKSQKKAIDYALKKGTPVIQQVGSQAINQLSTKVRPDFKYKTDRVDLDADMYKGGSFGQKTISKHLL